jgi:hypothetical protein
MEWIEIMRAGVLMQVPENTNARGTKSRRACRVLALCFTWRQ